LSDPLSHELQLEVAFELLHHFDLAEKSRSLSLEELDLIEFLVAQVALLSFSLAIEEPCDVVVAEPQDIFSVACELVELQPNFVSSSATPPVVMDMPVAIIGSPSPLVEALELHGFGVMVSFEAKKSPDIAPLEVGPKGASLLCSLRRARMAMKSHPPSKVISRRHLAHPRSSLCFGHCLYYCCTFWLRRCVNCIPPHCLVQGGGGSSWPPWMS
jgi:hypothetical protein